MESALLLLLLYASSLAAIFAGIALATIVLAIGRMRG